MTIATIKPKRFTKNGRQMEDDSTRLAYLLHHHWKQINVYTDR